MMTIGKLRGVGLLAGVSLVVMAIPAFAQSAPQSAPPPAPASVGIEDIVVTAQRRAENLQSTPISITALSSSSLERSGINDLTGVVRASPSLYFAPYPSSSTTLVLYMRGQGIGDPNIITKDGGVGLYVDGFYQSRPQASTFDLADVERVEVLRGPQGTLYGRNTTGGAVNIISKKPTGEFDVRGMLSFGNYDYRRALLNVDLPQFGDFKVKLTGLYSQRDGWARNAKNTEGVPDAHDFQADRKLAIRGAVRWEPTDNLTIDYAGDYGEQRTTPVRYVTPSPYAPALFPGYTDDPKRAYRAVYLPYSNVKSHGQSLTGEWVLNDNITLKSLTSYRNIKVSTYQDYTEAFLAPFYAYDKIDSTTWTQELQAVGQFADQFKYVVGLYYFHEKANHFETVDIGLSSSQAIMNDRDTEAKSTSKAVFGQLTWTPAFADDRLDLTVGARYTKDDRSAHRDFAQSLFIGQVSQLAYRGLYGPGFNVPLYSTVGGVEVHNSKFNPSFTASYKLTDDHMIFGKIVTGYKSGGSNEASPTFNRTFGPESVTSYEVGLKSDWLDRRIRLNVSGFIAKYKDLQLDISASAADASLADTFNVGRATVKGIEADLTIAPVRDLSFQANYAYTTSRIRDVAAPAGSIFDPQVNPGSPVAVGQNIEGYFVLPFTPKHSIRVSGDWTIAHFGLDELSFHADYTWKDKVYTTSGAGPSVPVGRDLPVNPSFGVADARLSYRMDRGGERSVNISLWGKNIFDKRYPGFIIGSGSIIDGYNTQAISYGDPATFGIDIGFDF